jgi:hypothetical protein
MKAPKHITSSARSKGAAIFKKMMEDKKIIREHIQQGGNISGIKRKFHFAKPLSTSGK